MDKTKQLNNKTQQNVRKQHNKKLIFSGMERKEDKNQTENVTYNFAVYLIFFFFLFPTFFFVVFAPQGHRTHGIRVSSPLHMQVYRADTQLL